MLIIHHRRNTPELLADTPRNYGVEIDIRSYGPRLIVHHDPYEAAISLEEWLEGYAHQFLILNTKEEGLETSLLELMNEQNIQDFFFLDQSFPFLIKTAKAGESRCAVRISEYESIQTALALQGLVDWVWVDIFTHFPLNKHEYQQLKEANYRLCLVSPELQGHPPNVLHSLQAHFASEEITVDAVCTKNPEAWLLTE